MNRPVMNGPGLPPQWRQPPGGPLAASPLRALLPQDPEVLFYDHLRSHVLAALPQISLLKPGGVHEGWQELNHLKNVSLGQHILIDSANSAAAKGMII